MARFFISPNEWNPDALILSGPEAHHARRVLRLKRGDTVIVFDGQGREITAEIAGFERGEIRLRKSHEIKTPPPPSRITLGQAIPKGKNMDLIVQKAVELGAAEIAPIISERTVVELGPASVRKKQAKWQQTAIEAAKQCGQNWLPQVRTPSKLKDFFSAAAVYGRRQGSEDFGAHPPSRQSGATSREPLQQLRLIGSLESGARHLKKVMADYSREHSTPPASVLMMIGPEGDFTSEELALAKNHGCIPVTLGPIILRVETAAIYCLSILSYELL